MSLEPLLEMQGISKTFNGLRVLKNVSLKVYPGEIHALMGENGAGKSTLMKILSGAYQADDGGTIRIDGPATAQFTAQVNVLGHREVRTSCGWRVPAPGSSLPGRAQSLCVAPLPACARCCRCRSAGSR